MEQLKKSDFMKRKQIISALNAQGIFSGRCFGSKTLYCKRHPKHAIVFNSKLYCEKGFLAGAVDLDLKVDAKKLTDVAKLVGERIYVLRENEPRFLWDEDDPTPLDEILPYATWWTPGVGKQDIFLPVPEGASKVKRVILKGEAGFWGGEPAYTVRGWLNPEIKNCNMAGAAVTLKGLPPTNLKIVESVPGENGLGHAPSCARGRHVRPVFFHAADHVQYVWFSNRKAIPALLYYNALEGRQNLRFIFHRDTQAMHIWSDGKMIGCLAPCCIDNPCIIASALAQLRRAGRPASGPGRRTLHTGFPE